MARITKDPVERKNEIIDVAEELFLSKGFEATAVSDIVGKIGVAQGLFYYYFKSKDGVLDAIVERYAELLLQKTESIADDPTMNASLKIQKIFTSMFDFGKTRGELVDRIHQESHQEMHSKIMVKMTEKLIPVFTALLRKGMTEGLFKAKHPDITAEILLIGLEYYLHKMIRECWGKPEFFEKMNLAMEMLEQVLGAPAGSLQL